MLIDNREIIVNIPSLKEEDLDIQAYRVNNGIIPRIIGIRIIHKNTGIVVYYDNKRSLQLNLDEAIKILENKLKDVAENGSMIFEETKYFSQHAPITLICELMKAGIINDVEE